MATIYPYLAFPGHTAEAFEFYKSVFGGEYVSFMKFRDMPQGDEKCEMPESELDMVMHVGLPVGDTILMGSDGCAADRDKMTVGGSISLSYQPDSESDADRIFQALSEGGQVMMPLSKTFWNAYFGMCKDKYGVTWMINYEYPQN